MFQGVVRISIAPFFKLDIEEDKGNEAEEGRWEVGSEKWSWRLVGRGEVRGPSM
jgi:hypothetical protein